MGCLPAALAGLLTLAIPAAIARASLFGALVVIAAFTALAIGGLRRRGLLTRTRTARTATVAIAYAAVVTAVHFVH